MKRVFDRIAALDPTRPRTWDDRTFLVFDLDWCVDDALHAVADRLEAADAAATFFVTHATPALRRLRDNPAFELGIHPNFNKILLEGSADAGATAREVLLRILDVVPEARSVRSHSLTQSSYLMLLFRELGLTHDVNHYVPASAGLPLVPWRDFSGLCRVPFFWEDDLTLLGDGPRRAAELTGRAGLQVYAFHPVHVALNSEALARYEAARLDLRDWARMQARAYTGDGVASSLAELLASAR